MRTRTLHLFAVALIALAVCPTAQAITWGEEDLTGEYENVASVRGISHDDSYVRWSCVGSLLHVDKDKYVILTAGHCTDTWITVTGAGLIDSVGVSFDQNNRINGSYSDGTYYVRGGVPISFPGVHSPGEKLDYGLVVFPNKAENSVGETIRRRWGRMAPVQLSPSVDYLPALIDDNRTDLDSLRFTAVGYGTGETFPIPGEEPGPVAGINLETFPIRHFADNLTYNAHNPETDVLHLSQNPAKDENGSCNGDSGGPIFYDDPELGRIQVSMVSSGDTPCRATTTGPALSLQEARDFVECGTVPGDVNAVMNCVAEKFSLSAY